MQGIFTPRQYKQFRELWLALLPLGPMMGSEYDARATSFGGQKPTCKVASIFWRLHEGEKHLGLGSLDNIMLATRQLVEVYLNETWTEGQIPLYRTASTPTPCHDWLQHYAQGAFPPLAAGEEPSQEVQKAFEAWRDETLSKLQTLKGIYDSMAYPEESLQDKLLYTLGKSSLGTEDLERAQLWISEELTRRRNAGES